MTSPIHESPKVRHLRSGREESAFDQDEIADNLESILTEKRNITRVAELVRQNKNKIPAPFELLYPISYALDISNVITSTHESILAEKRNITSATEHVRRNKNKIPWYPGFTKSSAQP